MRTSTESIGRWIVLMGFGAALAAQQRAVEQSARLPSAPTILWHLPKPAFYTDLAAHDGRIWLGGRHLSVHELKTGKELHRWHEEAEEEEQLVIMGIERDWPRTWRAPIHSGGIVFACTHRGMLHAFAPDLRHELWHLQLEPTHYPGMTVGDIFFAASGKQVIAVTGGKVHWRVDLGSDVAMTPASDGKRIFVGTADGDVVALDLHSGAERWRFTSDAEFGTTSPIVDRGTVFLADRGVPEGRKAEFHAFDAKTGESLWSSAFGSTGFSRPFATEHRVWAGFGLTVASFDRRTGELDWDQRISTGCNPFGLPRVVGDAVAFGNLDGNFYVHDLATRELRWRFDITGGKNAQVGGWRLIDDVLVVSTTIGVFGIGQAAGVDSVAAGFVLRPTER